MPEPLDAAPDVDALEFEPDDDATEDPTDDVADDVADELADDEAVVEVSSSPHAASARNPTAKRRRKG